MAYQVAIDLSDLVASVVPVRHAHWCSNIWIGSCASLIALCKYTLDTNSFDIQF